ncbi:MAG TPA: S8 family serine peptidase [Gemmatimonadota bacterium]|nr:S8 family serine peptidase [Gemmatimonadota bacterium]
MRRIVFAFAVASFAFACSKEAPSPVGPAASGLSPAASLAPAAEAFVPGHVVARFRPGAPVAQLVAAQNAAVYRDLALGAKLLSVPAGRELTVAAALVRSPHVEFAEPDWIRTLGIPCETGSCTPPNDTYFGYKWDLHNDGSINQSNGTFVVSTGAVDADIDWLEAFAALGESLSGAARVGILDTGVLASHQDLAGKVVAQYDFFADDPTAADDHGHGTHVSAIAAGAGNNGLGVTGVAWGPNVTLAVAKVCGQILPGPSGYGCPSSAIADGIVWATDNGAHVLNLSLGGGSGSSAERNALQYARSHDVLPFCAAGNSGGSVEYPAAFPECVAVSATDWSDGLASYSCFGPQVELSAPGGDTENGNGYSYILSAYNENNASYAFMAGTSMATPEAAGLAALLHALGTTGDDAILARMKSTADDLGAAGTDNQFGAGRINAYAAVTGSAPPPPPPSDITLAVSKRQDRNRWFADLSWSGATGASVDVYRNGALGTTTANDGAYSENLGRKPKGTFTYKVCEAGTTTCSNEASISF